MRTRLTKSRYEVFVGRRKVFGSNNHRDALKRYHEYVRGNKAEGGHVDIVLYADGKMDREFIVERRHSREHSRAHSRGRPRAREEEDYRIPRHRHHHVAPVVADFDTLDDLIRHAADQLGATHAAGSGAHTRVYFPRGGQYPYEEATVRRKAGYWHADGPHARVGVTHLPSDAKPIGGRRQHRAAEEPITGSDIEDMPWEELLSLAHSHQWNPERLAAQREVERRRDKRQRAPSKKRAPEPLTEESSGFRVDQFYLIDRVTGASLGGPFKTRTKAEKEKKRASFGKDLYIWQARHSGDVPPHSQGTKR